MTEPGLFLRPAKRADADAIVKLIDLAGEGLPALLWSMGARPGQSAHKAGRAFVLDPDDAFSYRRATVAVVDHRVAGLLLAERLPDQPAHEPQAPPLLAALSLLLAHAPGAWCVGNLAVFEKYRRRGIASALMEAAEGQARANGAATLCLVVAEENRPAVQFYERHGLAVRAGADIPRFPGFQRRGRWILMTKTAKSG